MSDSENQGTTIIPSWQDVAARQSAWIMDLEATITTLKAQLEAAEAALRDVVSSGNTALDRRGYDSAFDQVVDIARIAISAPASDTGSEEKVDG